MFSERERDIIKTIGRKKMSFKEIADQVFDGKYNTPFDSTITIRNSVERIIRKCEHYGLNWTLGKSRRENKYIVYKEKI